MSLIGQYRPARVIVLSVDKRMRDCSLLELAMFDVLVAAVSRVEELCEALSDEVFDVLVIDSALFDAHWQRISAAMVATRNRLGVVVLGNPSSATAYTEQLAQSADAWLQRPVHWDLLASTVRLVAQRRRDAARPLSPPRAPYP